MIDLTGNKMTLDASRKQPKYNCDCGLGSKEFEDITYVEVKDKFQNIEFLQAVPAEKKNVYTCRIRFMNKYSVYFEITKRNIHQLKSILNIGFTN